MEIGNSKQKALAPTELNHPFFQQNNMFVEQIKSLLHYKDIKELYKFTEEYEVSFNSKVFGSQSPEHFSQKIAELGFSFSNPCSKVIEKNEYYYRCLDCEKYHNMDSSFETVICRECFEKSNHTGHRVIPQKNIDSTNNCDCGDLECFEEAGFCDKHRYVRINPVDILEKFSTTLRTNFLEKCHEMFYTRLSLLEQSLINPDDIMRLRLEAVSLAVINPICDILQELIALNPAFIILVSYLFRTPLPAGKNLVFHDCDDVESITFTKEPHECKCTIVQIYVRFLAFTPLPLQRPFTDLFIELLRDDLFKEHINETFCKFISFLITPVSGVEPLQSETVYVHDMFRISSQLFVTEKLCKIPINNGTIHNLYRTLKRIIEKCTYPGEVVSSQFDEIESLIGFCFFPNHKDAGLELIKKEGHFKYAFEILMEYNTKFNYPDKIGIGTQTSKINYNLLNDIFIVSRSIEFLIERAYQIIEFVPNEEKKDLIRHILKEWNCYFEVCRDIVKVEQSKNSSTLFYPTFQRILALVLNSFVKPLTKDKLYKCLGETLGLINEEELGEFGISLGGNILHNFGIFRYIQLIHNYEDASLRLFYLFTDLLTHELDITTLQTTCLLLNKIDIFEFFTKSFFVYSSEITNFLLKGEILVEDEFFKEKITVIEDYLFMINHLMNDEVCSLSSQIGKQTEKIIDDPQFSEHCKKVMEKMIINLMSSSNWTTVNEVKQKLKNTIKEDKYVEEIVSEISDVDPSNMKIRLKDQYLKTFDPYFFYKTRKFQKDTLNGYLDRVKGSNVDIVSGQFYQELPQYLYDIQIKLFSSSLLLTIHNIIINWKNQYTPMLSIILRLVHLNVELINFLSDENKEILLEKFSSVFGNERFIEKLKEMLVSESLQDYHGCIKKIFARLKSLKANWPIPSVEESYFNKIEEKNLDQKEMLKEEFTAHQKVLKVNEKTKVKGEEAEENECRYCHETLDHKKTYGVPVYMCFTNNFDFDNSKLLNEINSKTPSLNNAYLQIKTCGHYFHQECYKKVYDQVWEPQNMARNQTIFWNFFETNCPVCKVLINNFLVISEEQKHPEIVSENEETRKQNIQKSQRS